MIGYNSLVNDFILMTNELYDLYSKTLSEDISKLAIIHPDFWEILISKHFIVSNEIDELQQTKELVNSFDRNQETYHLIINPTLNCNFKCWYCYETHINGSKMDNSTIEKIKMHIIKKLNCENIKQFTISWFGGEPLLYYHQVIYPILKFTNENIAKRNIHFNSNFTSNGYLINDKIVKEFSKLGINGFQITLDGHSESHNKVRYAGNKRGTYDKIVSNIIKCLKNKIYVTCRINISKETFNNIEKIIDDFSILTSIENEYLEFSFNQVWQEKEDLHEKILEIIELFNNHNFATQYNRYRDTLRNSCYADKENHATINFNGDVFKCTARDFNPENREGFLNKDGSIEWNQKYYTRMDAKFKNSPCLNCNILPICNGSCSQKALENKDIEYCINNFDENRKIDIIKKKFLFAIK